MAQENILIMAVKKTDESDTHFQSSIEELISLSHTAGGQVKKVIVQNRVKIHPATYIGSGKVAEIKDEIINHDIELVISNDELSPSQLRNLSEVFNVRLIDRSQLILDIFAQRAKTKEGQLQVELAQLEYMLPRLHGMGTILSRLGGGIGTRGPGETKLETDQRHIRRRIDDIKRRLQVVVKQRDQYRKRRKINHTFQIAIVGYTNAGKSTIFNRLTNEASLEEDLLFATLDPLTRKIQLPSGLECLLTDTVGFLQDLPTALIAAFRSTLEEVAEADFLLHIVDASHPDQAQHQETVNHILKELDAHALPKLTIYNKRDKIQPHFIPINHPYLVISAYDSEDVKSILLEIERVLKDEWNWYALSLDPDQGKLLSRLAQETIVEKQIFNDQTNQYEITGYVPQEHPITQFIKEQEQENDEKLS